MIEDFFQHFFTLLSISLSFKSSSHLFSLSFDFFLFLFCPLLPLLFLFIFFILVCSCSALSTFPSSFSSSLPSVPFPSNTSPLFSFSLAAMFFLLFISFLFHLSSPPLCNEKKRQCHYFIVSPSLCLSITLCNFENEINQSCFALSQFFSKNSFLSFF